MNEILDKLPKRFIEKVEFTDSCWLWTGSICRSGYGRIVKNNKNYLAHRFIWEHINGEIPNGLCVLHKCDVRKCVNPNHHFLGTNKDNNVDMWKKGRGVKASGERHGSRTHPERFARGENHKNAKLKQFEVDEIRRTYQRGTNGEYSIVGLAKKYGVTDANISDIINFKIWKGVS